MIRTDTEFEAATIQLTDLASRIARQKEAMAIAGLTPAQVEISLQPLQSWEANLRDETVRYRQLKAGTLEEAPIRDLRLLGTLLIQLRIARNWTQRDLALRLGVHESQVSRDERNEYRGVSVARASDILAALGAALEFRVVR